jgi:hydrogenase nickel incorporation protein HypB
MQSVTIGESPRILHVHQRLLGKNAEIARRNREFFRAQNLLTLNILSSPGAGKTALLERLQADRFANGKVGIIVGDLATDNDARRLSRFGARVIQVATGNICHLEADMIDQASRALGLEGLEVLIIENVGNLVCPAGYDLGEDLRVVLVSVTEGEDKPLKYPTVFKSADVVLITKIDLVPYLDIDRQKLEANIRAIVPRAEILAVSAKTGAGTPEWYTFLESRRRHVDAID